MSKRCPPKDHCCSGGVAGPGPPPPPPPWETGVQDINPCPFFKMGDFFVSGNPLETNIYTNPLINTGLFQSGFATFQKNANLTLQTVNPANGIASITPAGDFLYVPTQNELDLAASTGSYTVLCVMDALLIVGGCADPFLIEIVVTDLCPCGTFEVSNVVIG